MSDTFNLDASLGQEPELFHRLQALRSMHHVQHGPSNWNYSPYMKGMAMGLELALATMEDREPVFPPSIIEYLQDRQPVEGILSEVHPPPEVITDQVNVHDSGTGPWRTR